MREHLVDYGDASAMNKHSIPSTVALFLYVSRKFFRTRLPPLGLTTFIVDNRYTKVVIRLSRVARIQRYFEAISYRAFQRKGRESLYTPGNLDTFVRVGASKLSYWHYS